MAFRPFGPFPQFFLNNGKVNAGGSLTFYATDLTTLKNTWSDEALTILNTNPVLLDAAGRPVTDIWADGEYGVVAKDALGAAIGTRNNVQSDASATLDLPPLGLDQTYAGDGAGGVVAFTPTYLPDPTGFAGYMLVTDGVLWYPAPQPEVVIPDPEIVVTNGTTHYFQAGTSEVNTKLVIMTGTIQVSGSGGGKTSSASVTLPDQIDNGWFISLSNTNGPATPSGAHPTTACTGWTPGQPVTTFTAVMNIPDDDTNSAWRLSNNITFAWMAMGTRTIVSE